MERNKNRLELKTASDGPVPTKSSRLREAVMFNAANERIRMLSSISTTDMFWSESGSKEGAITY